MKIAIIGGGASGLFLASYLKRKNTKLDITIYERNKSLGRKLLATGNGKCNFMNFKAMPFDYNNPEFIAYLFNENGPEDLLNYFSSLGLVFKFDNEGRMYPKSESSATILNLFESDLANTQIKLEQTVYKIISKNNKVIINDTDFFDYAVISSGSIASIDEKKIKSTYSYLENLDINMVDIKPSLVGLKTKEDIKKLQGLRVKCTIQMLQNDIKTSTEVGELIFKEDGISGICVMNLSRLFNPRLKNQILIDLFPSDTKETLVYELEKRYKVSSNPKYYLAGLCHPKLIDYLLYKNITDINKVVDTVKSFKLSITSTYSFKDAQVVRGGISINEINSDLSLKKYPNIFATGEALDIDGKCGGYNLTFAFLSALQVGKALLKNED